MILMQKFGAAKYLALEARAHLDKLHTVGRPAYGHDIRLIDDAGCELPAGDAWQAPSALLLPLQGTRRAASWPLERIGVRAGTSRHGDKSNPTPRSPFNFIPAESPP